MGSRFRIRGPAGAVVTVEVPGPGVDQRTFDARVDSGEWTIVEDGPPDGPDPDELPAGNASREAWAAAADRLDVEYDDGDGRNDIRDRITGR